MLSFINSFTKTLAPNLAVLLALPMGFEEFSCVTPLKQKENTHPHNDLKTAKTRKVNHYFWRLVIYMYLIFHVKCRLPTYMFGCMMDICKEIELYQISFEKGTKTTTMDDQAAQVNVSLRISMFRVSALQGIHWWANWGWIFNLQTKAVMLLAFCQFGLLQSKSARRQQLMFAYPNNQTYIHSSLYENELINLLPSIHIITITI